MPVPLDLSDLESVKKAANTILTAASTIDLLYLNAGIAATTPKLTAQGYEEQFGVNYMGHALFTQMLLPKLLQTAEVHPSQNVRIVILSSSAHSSAPKAGILLDEVKSDMASTGAQTRYGQSKLAKILFGKKLATLYPSIMTASLHPGVVTTEIIGKANGLSFLMKTLAGPFMWLLAVTVQEGAKNQLWAGTAADVKSGEYYVPIGKLVRGSPRASDAKLQEELWEWTDEELKAHGGPGWP